MRKSSEATALNLQLEPNELSALAVEAAKLGYLSVSDYVLHLHREHVRITSAGEASSNQAGKRVQAPTTFYRTALGEMLMGDALGYMNHLAAPKSVDLVMTSPPFGLVRKKSYGNEDASVYCDWFRPFAEGFRRILKDNGSLVIDIGGAWKPGTPTRSLYHFELLIMLCKEYGFHLCQEHYWWSPSKLPTPAEWVNVRRIRVKDAVNSVWWLSPSPWPKANNAKVLAPYSESMKDLFRNGYKAKLRPSGHDISTKFSNDNGGSVPPNLLAIANTESNGRYQSYCREKGLPIHPARFPTLLPEYFIRLLTDPGDLVFDPFGGSCVTGAVAESLGRHWVCTELSEEYLKGALARFDGAESSPVNNPSKVTYQISTPCAVPVDESKVRVFADGGFRRRPRSEDSSS